jgi:hypothetical protein
MFTLLSLDVADLSLCATNNQVKISFVHFILQELAKMRTEAQTPEVEGEDGINPEVLITEETGKKETKLLKHEGEISEHDEFEDMAEDTGEASDDEAAK